MPAITRASRRTSNPSPGVEMVPASLKCRAASYMSSQVRRASINLDGHCAKQSADLGLSSPPRTVSPEVAGMPDDLSNRFAILRLPHWLWGSNPARFGDEAQWILEPLDAAVGEWTVRLQERVRRRPGRLVQIHQLARRQNADTAGAYARLRRLPDPPSNSNESPQRIQDEVDRVARDRPNDLVALLYSGCLATTTAPPEHLPAVVQQVLRDGLIPLLPDSAVYLVEVQPALAFRYAATRLLLQIGDDPSLLSRRPETSANELTFNSARGLFSDTTFGLGAYLSPLFLSLSPWVWGVTTGRAGGVIAYTFGRAVPGRRGEASEPLQLFLPSGEAAGHPAPTTSASAVDAALKWWIRQLDFIFTEITDPARYIDAGNEYSVRRNFEVLLSIEQAFRNVQSLSAHERDAHVRRLLMFDTLDTLEGLRAPSFDRMCELSHARRALIEIEQRLDPAAVPVLLPRAHRAVAALERLQSGFFLRSRLTSDGLRVPDRQGGDRTMSSEAATAAYLRVLRNAGHAFGGRPGRRGRDEVLLMSHSGEIPRDLPELGYLYLLRLLARPEDLRYRS
jgi:hypothetical protein